MSRLRPVSPGGETIKVRLTSAGVYANAIEIRTDRSRRTHPLQTPDALPLAPVTGTP